MQPTDKATLAQMGWVLKEFAEGERGLRLFGKLYEVACRGRRPSVTRVVNTLFAAEDGHLFCLVAGRTAAIGAWGLALAISSATSAEMSSSAEAGLAVSASISFVPRSRAQIWCASPADEKRAPACRRGQANTIFRQVPAPISSASRA
jgi:hypothetical protein